MKNLCIFFFGEKGVMLYLLIAAGAVVLFVIIYFIVLKERLDKTKLDLSLLEEAKRHLTERCDALQETLGKLNEAIYKAQNEIDKLNDKKVFVMQATDMAKERLKSEHERVAAELKHVKELEEEKMKHEFEKKEQILTSQYTFKKQQFVEDFEELQEFYWDRVNEAKATLEDFAAR